MALVALTGLTKRFDPARPPAVEDLSLAVQPGEILALLGPSGCGKTTTLRLVAGFETPDAGRIVVAGRTVADGPSLSLPPEARGVGIVFQDYALFPHLTVAENVGFGLAAANRATRRERVGEMLRLIGLAGDGDRYPHELSGGQQQRVAVGRALAPGPAVLLLDEPFSSLDADLRAQMRDDVARILRTTGTTAIFVTHDQEEAFTIADRVGVLAQGRLQQVAAPETIYHQPATPFVAGFVGAAEFVPGIVTADGIATEVGVFGDPAGRAPGTKVQVMLRPDDVTFVVTPAGEAVVLRRYFRGSETLYCLGLPSGLQLYSSQGSISAVPLGTRVRLEARVLHVVAFPAE